MEEEEEEEEEKEEEEVKEEEEEEEEEKELTVSVSHDGSSLLCFSVLLTLRFARFFLTRRAVSLASPLCSQHCWIILDIPRNT